MARGFETGSDNEKIDEIQRQLDDVIDSQINSVGGNEDISIDSTRGSRNAASGDSGGVRSNQPVIHQITDVDSLGSSTGVFDKINLISSMIIVDFVTPAVDMELRFIQGTAKDGAKIKITPKVGRTLIIKSGGNILTGSDITISDTEFYELIKHSEAETGVTGGAYKITLSISGGGSSPPFIDSDPLIKGSVDPTKLLKFEIDGFAPGVTRTITIPDASTTMAGLGVLSQTWTGTNIFVGNTTVRDTNFFIQQTSDITKQAKFDLAGATSGKVLTLKSNHTDNRTLTFPDSSTILAGLGVSFQSWTGSNDFTGLVTLRDTFLISNISDITKQIRFDVSSITTGTIRTLVFPDSSTTLAGLGVLSQTWTGTNIFVGNTAIRDTNFFIQDGADITKQLNFELSGGTTGFVLTLASIITGNRTLTFPDTTTDLAGLGVLSQTWTGTNIFVGITQVRTGNFKIQNTADPTKQLDFALGGATTGKIITIVSNHSDDRILVLPDSSTDLAGLGVLSQTWTGTNDFVGITTAIDSNFGIKDFSDNTKVINFDASLITTATTRIYSFPDSTTTIAGLGVLSQTWTGTNDFFGITKVKTDNSFFLQDVTDPTKQVKWNLSGITTATIRTITMPDADVLLGSGSGADLSGIQDAEIWLDHETDQYNFEMYHSNCKVGSQLTSAHGLIQNTSVFVPLYIGKRARLVKISIDVKTGGTGVYSLEFGIYSRRSLQNYPETLLASNTGIFTGTGVKTIIFTEDLEAGMYFLAILVTSADSPIVSAPAFGEAISIGFQDQDSPDEMRPLMGYAGVDTSLPSTADDEMFGLSTGVPPAVFAKFNFNPN